MIRAQYYFRRSDHGLLAWDIRRLVELTRDFPLEQVPLSDIAVVAWANTVDHRRITLQTHASLQPAGKHPRYLWPLAFQRGLLFDNRGKYQCLFRCLQRGVRITFGPQCLHGLL